MQYQNIDADLDNGKKCCLCCGLELGFNIIGVCAFINSILYGYYFFNIVGLAFHWSVIYYCFLTAWSVLYGIVWITGFIARRQGNS